MAKFKVNDTVTVSDGRVSRILEVREDGDAGPRYYVTYTEGGGRGWWPEDRLATPEDFAKHAKDGVTGTAAVRDDMTRQVKPSPTLANKSSSGKDVA